MNQTEPCGVLVVNKHAGVTSHDVVGMIRKLYETRRVGHTGTLDPMATGVLTVLIGRAAKAAEYLAADRKTYHATLRLGMTSDTEDSTGTILTTSDAIPSPEQVQAILPRFRGSILQTPPMYSALKVNGQKLVDLARRGETVDRQPREISILSLEAEPLATPTDYRLSVVCSGGTYIRTLCADIGAALGCGGLMASLERTESGCFSIRGSHSVEELSAMTAEERLACLLSMESLFRDLPSLGLSAFHEHLIRNGCAVAQRKLGNRDLPGTRLRLLDASGSFFALGEVTETEEEPAVKAVKLFVLPE